ncbi:MAG: decarboxylating NADP(+)-dependent phosphogluconate dehydrogenase [Bacteroidota bacterium]
MIYMIMGVSGAGKTSVGRQLAQALQLPFYDGDDYHPPANIDKMSKGIPLEDADRWAWLKRINELARTRPGGAVIACSALKQAYRQLLAEGLDDQLRWVYLKGDFATIRQRMESREGHFMPLELLQSQFDALEAPAKAIVVDIQLAIPDIVKQILKQNEIMDKQSAFGLIGLGVMGASLSLNMIDRGFSMSLYNRHVDGLEEKVAERFIEKHQLLDKAQGFDELPAFIQSLARPRKILMMVKAGDAIDQLMATICPLLEPGDILIDGGNSNYKDTRRRSQQLSASGLHFFGVGISGGEEGARRGPSIMPGGHQDAYVHIQPYLESIAARNGVYGSCCTYIGPEGAGHFVKMVHNGIEYAEMQLLAELYNLCRQGLAMSPPDIAQLLESWRKEDLDSYLLEITIDILRKPEQDGWLIDSILDKAGNKGTGSWTTIAAAELGVPTTMITAALFARYLSSFKSERIAAAEQYSNPWPNGSPLSTDQLKAAYRAARIINHHQGFQLMAAASETYHWNLQLSEIARIWTKGCIIRSTLMESLIAIAADTDRLLRHPSLVGPMEADGPALPQVLHFGFTHQLATPCFSAAANFLIGYTSADSPANLLQAQRDYFGAHTYQRRDDPSGAYYHTIWKTND